MPLLLSLVVVAVPVGLDVIVVALCRGGASWNIILLKSSSFSSSSYWWCCCCCCCSERERVFVRALRALIREEFFF
jgi:hypothetical protein